MGNVIRTQGRPGLSLSFMAGGNVVNVLLAAVAIYGLGLGVPGAAAATAIAYVVSFSAQVLFVQSRSSHLHIRRRHLAKNPAVARSILKLGAPILLMHVIGSMVFLAANHGAALVGTHGVAAVGVFNTVSVLLIYPPLGVAQALQPLVGFNRGADKLDRVRSLLGRALLMTSVMSITSAIAAVMLSVAMVSLPLTAAHYFLAMQQARQAGLLLLGRQLLSIPLFAILPLLIGFPGLYYAPVLADLPFALFAAVLMRREWLVLGRRMREPNADPPRSSREPLRGT
jgi:Na+-driven multidrug efflux pump